ncbi:MAG: aminotransferase class V-fold PLP-dependent enzyme [Firmicutes bacterium]|nr:aminotransferase class V-fold PLP-dependent enzyme [Bacillota bacterium]
MNQDIAPFWDALYAYRQKGVVPFHTPGHKLQVGPFQRIEAALGSGFFALDPSDEIENAAIDHDFEEALREAEALAAGLFGARSSMFSVNGTTGGLHYLLMPTRGTVLIPRFSHQAVYSAMMLAQGEAAYVPSSYDPEWLIPLQPQPEQIEDILADHPVEAVVLTHPTYYGTVADLSELIQRAQKYDTLVFVDEAHGGHFAFSQELPRTALQCGADAVVQSTHKTLGSFTQTSMLHFNNESWYAKAVEAQRSLQTTSPSLVFLAVLDEVRRVLAEGGADLVGQALELAYECRKQLASIRGVELLPRHLQADPTKIVFSLRELGLTGIEVERLLRMDYNIQVELSDYYAVLALISLGDTRESVARLIGAVADLSKRRHRLSLRPLKRYAVKSPELPPILMGLREAFFQEQAMISLAKAEGKVSGGFLTPYPPGVPVIAPGEQFTSEVIEYLLWCSSIGWPIRGLMPEQKVVILEDNGCLCRKTR